MEVDYYYLLGIPEDASQREIKAAYRRMAEVYHPDKLRHLPEDSRREGEEIMRLLNEAKSVLLNPQRRSDYDQRIGVGKVKAEAVVMEEFGPSGGKYVAIEKDRITDKMARVLGTMKEVFKKDKDFQTKIAVAEEVVEANITDEADVRVKRKPVRILVEDDEIEMSLEFKRVSDESVKVGPAQPSGKKARFKILAMEADDADDESEDVEVDWEEG